MVNIRRPNEIKTPKEEKEYIKEIQKTRRLARNSFGLSVMLPKKYCQLKELRKGEIVEFRIIKRKKKNE